MVKKAKSQADEASMENEPEANDAAPREAVDVVEKPLEIQEVAAIPAEVEPVKLDPVAKDAPQVEPEKVHSLAEIKAICAGIWAGYNSRSSSADGKPLPELAEGMATAATYAPAWAANEGVTLRLRAELVRLHRAVIAALDGGTETEREAAQAARGVVQIIDAGA